MAIKGFRPGKHPAEINQKEQEKKKKDFEKRLEEMKPKLVALLREYKVEIVGAMDYRPNGAFPIVAYMDVKDKFENKEAPQEEKPKGLIT